MPFTVGFGGSYRISVRNVGNLASSGSYTVANRLPAGLTLAATFTCTSSTDIAGSATAADAITATVNVAAAAAAASPVNNAASTPAVLPATLILWATNTPDAAFYLRLRFKFDENLFKGPEREVNWSLPR